MTRVLLAGAAGEPAGRHHQRDMYAPAVAASSWLEVVGVWPGPPGCEGYERATAFAGDLGVPVRDALGPALDGTDVVVACLDERGLDALLDASPRVPVLVDKLALLGTSRLEALGADARASKVVAAYHPRFHPSAAALAASVATGDLGLPHALHGELLVPFGDGPNDDGDLRHVVVLALDVVAAVLGPPSGSVHAVRTTNGEPATECWTLTVRWHPGVVVTLVVSRGQPGPAVNLHRYRVLGSEGQALADLANPRLRLVGSGDSVGYGPGPVQLELETLAAGGRGTTPADLARISRVLDAAERSAADGQAHPGG